LKSEVEGVEKVKIFYYIYIFFFFGMDARRRWWRPETHFGVDAGSAAAAAAVAWGGGGGGGGVTVPTSNTLQHGGITYHYKHR